MSAPNSFILIVDGDGDSVDVLSASTSIDVVMQILRYHDKNSDNPPHSAWEYSCPDKDNLSVCISTVTDEHPDSISARERKLKQAGFEDVSWEQKCKGNFGAGGDLPINYVFEVETSNNTYNLSDEDYWTIVDLD